MVDPNGPQRPNIVFICVDQWRGDCLEVSGHPAVSTPTLNGLALDGVRFDHAYSAVPSCIAARAAMFTGLDQRHHGRVGYQDWVTWNYPVTLAGEFTRHGYQTQAIGKMHVWPERAQTGFQNVILHDGYLVSERKRNIDWGCVDDYIPWLREKTGDPHADYWDHGVDCNSYIARPWARAEQLHPTNWVAEQGIQFLRRRDPTKPFFLFLSFFHPHPPYIPPAWAFEQYLHQELPAPPQGDWMSIYDKHCGWLSGKHRQQTMIAKLSAPLLQRARAGYYGHITHIDLQIYRVLEALGGSELAANTVICFTSDHGEMLGDHNLFRKCFPYEGSARVPLILRAPGWPGIKPGAALPHPVELRDIMPTLLDCAGLPIPEGLDGRSFLPLARGETTPWREYVHGEHALFGQSIHYLTSGREKYIWLSGSDENQIFDLDNDPQELHDLAPERPERVAFWRRTLAQELAGREEGYSDGERLVAGRPPRATLSHIIAG